MRGSHQIKSRDTVCPSMDFSELPFQHYEIRQTFIRHFILLMPALANDLTTRNIVDIGKLRNCEAILNHFIIEDTIQLGKRLVATNDLVDRRSDGKKV